MVQVWIDGKKLIEYQDPQPLPAGMISLEAHAPQDPNTMYYFDDLSVCELSAPFTTSLYKPPRSDAPRTACSHVSRGCLHPTPCPSPTGRGKKTKKKGWVQRPSLLFRHTAWMRGVQATT